VVSDKSQRTFNFHRQTLKALAELVGAAALDHPSQSCPRHLMHCVADGTATFTELYQVLKPRELPSGNGDTRFR
jgi:hypothetical protein